MNIRIAEKTYDETLYPVSWGESLDRLQCLN